MDRERTPRDARAAEDPIAAIFELAESVVKQTPKTRRMLRYVVSYERSIVPTWSFCPGT